MTDQINKLDRAISELSTCVTPWQRPSRQKAVLLYGGRVRQWTQEIQATLAKQLTWLDQHPDNDRRHDEWLSSLRQYERACQLLHQAEELMGRRAA